MRRRLWIDRVLLVSPTKNDIPDSGCYIAIQPHEHAGEFQEPSSLHVKQKAATRIEA